MTTTDREPTRFAPVIRYPETRYPSHPDTVSGRAFHVLLVEDDDDVRDMYARYLVRRGLFVVEAASGEQALEMARALRPDVVVMDLAMPGMGGCEAARRMSAAPSAAGLAIIAFSADDSPANRHEARDAGCCTFVSKPCAPERLLSIVLAACGVDDEH